MKNPLLARLERLEAQYKPVPSFAYRIGVVVKELPRDFVGERHIAILRERSDGLCEFEERPGPERPGLRDDVPWVILTEAEANA
jgi:hypothetical protein